MMPRVWRRKDLWQKGLLKCPECFKHLEVRRMTAYDSFTLGCNDNLKPEALNPKIPNLKTLNPKILEPNILNPKIPNPTTMNPKTMFQFYLRTRMHKDLRDPTVFSEILSLLGFC